MTRRELFGAAALLAGSPPDRAIGGGREFYAGTLQQLVDGYLKNARATSPSMAVCDFAGGSKRPDGLSRSGKSYASVSRMLPAFAALVASGRDPDGQLFETVVASYRYAFDPSHPDYWLPAPPDKPDLRQVEASLIAWVLWLLRDRLLARLTKDERGNLQNWLASATVQVVRYNNFAWFTAVNQAVRLSLSAEWPEFQGDEQFMLDDLAAMAEMHAGDGWYGDGKGEKIYDYYSFWVFSSHYSYWSEIIGDRYPEWKARFKPRARKLLEVAPQLFGSNGSQALFGVSLVYRWAVLTALVLGYRQGMWPHSPGLLRAIVRRNISFFWHHGAFDASVGRLREVLSEHGTDEFAESYIDNGHPYWCMQAYAFLLIPASDPFWTAEEADLPCDCGDFSTALAGPKLLIAGIKSTGDVRAHFADNGRFDPVYRDRYTKFSYSARVPFCFIRRKDRATWDSALVFRDPKTGFIAGRAGVVSGKLIDGGVETDWWAELDDVRVRVVSSVYPQGERELRQHTIECPDSALDRNIEIWEGSHALPLSVAESIESRHDGVSVTASATAGAVGVLEHHGYREVSVESEFESILGRGRIHTLAPRCAIVTLRGVLQQPKSELRAVFLCAPSAPKGGYA